MEGNTAIGGKVQVTEHIKSIVNDLDTDGIRHAIIEHCGDYIIIRANNNFRSVTKCRLSSRLMMSIPAQGEYREEILDSIREGLNQAERDLLQRRGRG